MNNYVGKTYTFESVAFPGKMLNVVENPEDGVNVCLSTGERALKQRWKVVETDEVIYKLQTMKNAKYVLDRYVGSGSNYNNADVWTESANSNAEQEILIGRSLGNIVYISMPVYNGNTYVTTYYLTAVSNDDGTSGGKTSTSAGNVYWAEPLGENGGLTSAQKWRMVESPDSTDYCWPTESHNVTQYYNPDPNPYYNHEGIDIRGFTPGVDGDDIYAYMDGYVSYVGDPTSNPKEGHTVRIHHINPLSNGYDRIRTQYMHLASAPLVSLYDYVNAGDLIGYMGNTGNSNGVHLHFEIRGGTESQFPLGGNSSNGYKTGDVLDPTPYLDLT